MFPSAGTLPTPRAACKHRPSVPIGKSNSGLREGRRDFQWSTVWITAYLGWGDGEHKKIQSVVDLSSLLKWLFWGCKRATDTH